MQKIISAILCIISLFLLVSASARCNEAFLTALPFFANYEPAQKKTITYYGKNLVKQSAKKAPSSLYAKAYCLLDPDADRVLAGKNENEKLPMASTTKIMTCIVALEHAKSKQTVTFSSHAASMPDVQLNASANDTFYLTDLLYSLMLESHNDTAVAIAESIGGTVEKFANLMNQKAKKLGLTNTHFVTPNGLDAKEHYTTAKELCLLADYALKNKEFRKIIAKKSHHFRTCDGKKSFTAYNRDAFLTNYPGAIGIKTGYTNDAGYCFCGAAKKNNKTLITSVLGCGWPPHKTYKWSDTSTLMNYGFQNFESVSVTPDPNLHSISIKNGQKKELPVTFHSPDSLSFYISSDDKIVHKTIFQKEIVAPIKKNTIVGFEKYYINKTFICKFPIRASQSVKTAGYHDYLNALFPFLFFGKAN